MYSLSKIKKIFFVLEHLSGQGGVETVVTKVVNELEKRGYIVVVLLPNRSDDDIWELNLHNVYYYNNYEDCKNRNDLDSILSKVKGINRILIDLGKPDIIIGTHMPITVLYSRLVVGYEDVKVISWMHSSLELFGNSSKYLKHADIHWSISTNLTYELERLINKKYIYSIPNPIDINVDMLDISLENNFVYIGRLENYTKRFDILFTSLSKLDTEWTLDIYGDGPDKKYIECIINELDLNDKVKMKGYVRNPWKHINYKKALLLSSEHEAFPMVILEALSRGIPVVATECGGIEEIIKYGYNGYLAKVCNSESFYEEITQLLNLSYYELCEMQKNARQSVHCYSTNIILDKMEETFDL
ncbi:MULTISPECIES: glycosyltransferase [unclassified Clostridioides]|uniref:glycosyltransferase n=1 Tax=unclassified Clostridioides TaxID=2635829 RepID=UPI0038A97406